MAERIVVGDALAATSPLPLGSFDVVVGNPPFLSQLGAVTARDAEATAALRDRFGAAIGAYTDPAAVFLLAGLELARPEGGVVALVEPVSVLSSRDAGGMRETALEQAALTDLWVVGDGGFDASVDVCVPVLVRSAPDVGATPAKRRRSGAGASATRVHRGSDRAEVGVASVRPGVGTWSGLLAVADDLPERDLAVDGVLGDLARPTADFRDQYYGLAADVVDRAEVDDPLLPPLVTVGLIDPGRLWWGERATRFNKVSYRHPRVAVDDLESGLQTWARARLVPKVLLATQTRVLEAVADPEGRLLPSVPVVSVVPDDPSKVWLVAAVLTCPAVALVAARRHGGSGRGAGSLRVRASEVAELPLPADRAAWDAAAALLRAGVPVAEVGAAMDRAYGLADDPELLDWWLARHPRR